MSESKKYKLIYEKLLNFDEKNFRQGGLSNIDEKEYSNLHKELYNHQNKLSDFFRDNYRGKIDKKIYSKIMDSITDNEIFSLDEIPELKTGKKEITKKPSSTLAKLKEEVNELIPTLTSAQKKLIVKIPHDTYTAKNIYQIIKYIHSGEIKKESDFPKAGKGKKVNLEDLIPIKKKNKNLNSDLKTEKKSSNLKEEVDELIPQLTKEQKKLIVKIPHDTYTAKNIYQIIKMIHSGQIKTENDFPKPGKGKITNIEVLYPIKKKLKLMTIEEAKKIMVDFNEEKDSDYDNLTKKELSKVKQAEKVLNENKQKLLSELKELAKKFNLSLSDVSKYKNQIEYNTRFDLNDIQEPKKEEPKTKKAGRPKKIIVEESKTEIIEKPKGKVGRPKKIVVEEVKVEKKPKGRPRKTPKEEMVEVEGNEDLPKNIYELAEMNSEIYMKTKNFKDPEYKKIKKLIDALEEEYKAYVDKYKANMDEDTYNDVMDLIDVDDEQVGTLDDIDKYINDHNSKDFYFPIEERKAKKTKNINIEGRKKGYNKDGSKRKTRTHYPPLEKLDIRTAKEVGKLNAMKLEYSKLDYYMRNYETVDKNKFNNKSKDQLKEDKKILKVKMQEKLADIEAIEKEKKKFIAQLGTKKKSKGKGIYTHMSDDDYSSDDFEV